MQKQLILLIFLSQLSLIGLAENRIAGADTLIIKDENVFFTSEDSVCSVSIIYPIIYGMKGKTIEDKINSFLKIEFLDSPEWLSIEDCDHEIGFTYESDYSVRYNSTGFISIQQYVYEYSGGAHGNYAMYSYNFNLNNGELLYLSNVIKDDQQNKLSEIAVAKLLEDKKAATLIEAGLFEDTLSIPPEQDFYIVPGFLILQFDPYEIASYAAGEIEIQIPLKSIKDLLKPDIPFSISK